MKKKILLMSLLAAGLVGCGDEDIDSPGVRLDAAADGPVVTDGGKKDAATVDGRPIDANTNDANVTDADTTDGRTADGATTDAVAPDALAPDALTDVLPQSI